MSISTIFGLVVTFGLFVLGLIFRKSRPLFFVQLLWLWIMICLNYDGVDYSVHQGMYNASSSLTFSFSELFNSWLYKYILYDAKLLGISFFSINLILNSIVLFLIYKLINNNTKNTSLACSFLLVYPFVEFIIQKRFFIASIFSIYGLEYLFKGKKWYKSVIFLFIGGLLHQAAFTYFIIYFLLLINHKTLKKILPIIIILAYLSIPIMPKVALLIFPASKVNLYFYTLRIPLFDSICWMLLHILFVLFIYILHKKICKNDKTGDDYEEKIYILNLISLILLPLYYYEPTFIRFYRTILIFNYILISRKIRLSNSNKWTKNEFYFMLIWCIYLISVYLMVYVFTGADFNYTISPEYEYNYFIHWIFGG